MTPKVLGTCKYFRVVVNMYAFLGVVNLYATSRLYFNQTMQALYSVVIKGCLKNIVGTLC
jgi:hypothetical protein